MRRLRIIFSAVFLLSMMQNANAFIYFGQTYQLNINGKYRGTMTRSINPEQQLSIVLNLTPPDSYHYFEQPAGGPASLASATAMNNLDAWYSAAIGASQQGAAAHLPQLSHELSITFNEISAQLPSVTYDYLQAKIPYSLQEAAREDTKVISEGNSQSYRASKEGITRTPKDGEGLSEDLIVASDTITNCDLLGAACADIHQCPPAAHYLMFGSHFEQLLNTLHSGGVPGGNSGLVTLHNVIFPVFIPQGAGNLGMAVIGLNQELTHHPETHQFIQQDKKDDPCPSGFTATYEYNPESGVITAITIHDQDGTQVALTLVRPLQPTPLVFPGLGLGSGSGLGLSSGFGATNANDKF